MKRKLGEILIERRLVTQRDIDAALSDQRAGEPSRLGDLLVAMGKVSPVDLARALSTQAGLPFAELGQVPPELLALLPLEALQRLRAVPFRQTAAELHVALADPANLEQLEELVGSVGKKLQPHVAPADEVEAMLAQAAGSKDFASGPRPRSAPTEDELFGTFELEAPDASGELDSLFAELDGGSSGPPPEVRPPPPAAPAPKPPAADAEILAQLAQEEQAEAATSVDVPATPEPGAAELEPMEAVVVEEEDDDEPPAAQGRAGHLPLPRAPASKSPPRSEAGRAEPPAKAPARSKAAAPPGAAGSSASPRPNSPPSAAAAPPGAAGASPSPRPHSPPARPTAAGAERRPEAKVEQKAPAAAGPAGKNGAGDAAALPAWLEGPPGSAAAPAPAGWSGELDVVAPSKVALAVARALVQRGILTEAELLALLGKD